MAEKRQKKIWIVVAVVALAATVLLVVGLLWNRENDAEQVEHGMDILYPAEHKEVNEEENMGAEVGNTEVSEDTETTIPEAGDETSRIYPWADLDGDGTEEYILVESGAFFGGNVENGRITVYVNDEPVYQYTEELRIMGVDQMEYLDLDGDGQEEIFVSFGPAVNSMPLEEWFVLKKVEGGWKLLEMHHNSENMLDNAFPITVVLKKGQFGFGIRCEGWDGEIDFDATARYERLKEVEMGNDVYTAFVDAAYEIGDVVGGPMSWGVWFIDPGTYEEKKCLIANHGLCGGGGKYEQYGWVNVYFDYDAEGKIRILDMTFSEVEY